MGASCLLIGILGACGGSEDADDDGPAGAPVDADRCRVLAHGKGGAGAPATVADGVATLSPSGNGEGWGGREWRYATPDELDEAIAIVTAAIDAAACERVALHGFSNGASFAAALWCSGTDLDRRLVGVVIDDPVTDESSSGCAPAAGVEAALYWTGALASDAPPGTACSTIDWTCAGGTVRSIDDYAADLGLPVTPSPFDTHTWYLDAPEPGSWLAG